jgi:hypothetical protein
MAAVTYANVCSANDVRAGVRVVGALPSTTTACCATSACIPALCNRLNLVVISQVPYTKMAGTVLAFTPPINAKPSQVITTGLPWNPVLVGRPNATLTTDGQADLIRQALYPNYGPIAQKAAILSYNMVASSPVAGTTYKEATGTIAAYPRADVATANSLTAVPSAVLGFVFRWCAPFASACTGNPVGLPPFEVLTTDSGPSKGPLTTSVRFLFQEWLYVPMVPGSDDPRCLETCAVLILEQACPPVPSCLAPCAGAQPYLPSTFSDVNASDALFDGTTVTTVTMVYSGFSGVGNIQVQPITPPPAVTSVVVQPIPGVPNAVKLTFMVIQGEEVYQDLTFAILADILSPACLHSSDVTFVESILTVPITVG